MLEASQVIRHMTFCLFFLGIAVLSDLAPKTNHMFHFTGKQQSTPNCPVQLVANFNPGTGSQSYRSSDKDCTTTAKYRLPFYLKDMGPRYNAISVGAHEARPGHHTQVRHLRQFFFFTEYIYIFKRTIDCIADMALEITVLS